MKRENWFRTSWLCAAFALCFPLVSVSGPRYFAFYGEKESVKPGELLKVTFRAAVTNGASVETRPLAVPSLMLAACADHALPEDLRFPRTRVRFFTAEGRPAKELWLCQGSVLVSTRTAANFRHAVYQVSAAGHVRFRRRGAGRFRLVGGRSAGTAQRLG